MKITGIEVILVSFPSGKAIRDAMRDLSTPCGVITKILTDEGLIGWAYTFFGYRTGAADALKVILEKVLGPAIIGSNFFYTKQIRETLLHVASYSGIAGINHFGIAAVDMALWDLIGKAANQPVYKILGACRDKIPAYAMVGWYYNTEEEFVMQCKEAVKNGFKAIKIKVGKDCLRDDLKRIKLIRENIGPDIRIMVDANQAFDEAEALRRGREYEKYDIFWFEEPIQIKYKNSLKRLADSLQIQIAAGENEYSKYDFWDLIKSGSAKVIQLDNRRAGGVTEWMEIAAIADIFGMKIASHGGGPANVNMLCAIPNAIYLEKGNPLYDKIFVEQLDMIDGCVLAPSLPGLGLEVKQEVIDEFKVNSIV